MEDVTIEFDSPVNEEGSWGERPVADKAHSVMTYRRHEDGAPANTHGEIEWIITGAGDFNDVVHIGIWTEMNVLVDYDGVMSFPAQAATLLRKAGIVVTEDFID